MFVSEITLLDVFRNKFHLSEQDARELTKEIAKAEILLQDSIDKKFDSRESSIRGDIAALRAELKDHFATKEDLAKQIGETKADLIKWMFIFWVSTIGVLSGIMFALIHVAK